MDNNRKTEKIVGVLFIVATVAYSFSAVLLDPILDSAEFLAKASENGLVLIFGVLLILVNAVAVASIAVMLFPVLKKYSETSAVGYVCARLGEGILFCVNAIFILTVLVLSQEFAKSGALDITSYQAVGTAMLAASNWSYLLGLGLSFSISAVILNTVLYNSKLVPRWLSAWGFVGAILVLANFLIESFGIRPIEILFIPIAIQEMVFAIWLIVKGFDYSPVSIKKDNCLKNA